MSHVPTDCHSTLMKTHEFWLKFWLKTHELSHISPGTHSSCEDCAASPWAITRLSVTSPRCRPLFTVVHCYNARAQPPQPRLVPRTVLCGIQLMSVTHLTQHYFPQRPINDTAVRLYLDSYVKHKLITPLLPFHYNPRLQPLASKPGG